MTSPATDGSRTIALPLDRVYAFGAGVEWEWHGNLEQDGGLAGRIKGSFDTNYAVVLDTQIIKRF